jgi:ABC-type phosphate transport system substrate-binding protein
VAANNGCLQFARSSSNDAASRGGKNLTYIPFAVDAVAYATRSSTNIPNSLSIADLKDVYNCVYFPDIKPLLPQFNSGTRKFFLGQLGFADSAGFAGSTGHACVKDTDSSGKPLLENTGNLLTDGTQIEPYSISSFIAQSSREVPDVHGFTVLGEVDGKQPLVLNTSSTMSRDVYNVVPNSQLGVAPTSTTFVGSGSAVCTNTDTIKKLGFGVNANCGSTAIQTP